MDYSSLKTARDIMNAFQQCQNAGEQIDLFEALATSYDPPVPAFVEILRGVKLEPLIFLTIYTFGKIRDADIRERLQQSEDLLAILSEQAKSGQTDLIRWSAAITIENLGFDFIAVSQHLTVEPKNIADRIMRAKLKRLDDKNLLSSNDFDEYLNFWIYGNLTELKIKTASIIYGHNPQCEQVISKIFSALALRAIKDVNKGLERAEFMGNSALEVDENELFELAACEEAMKQIKNQVLHDELMATQVHCLQSRNRKIRNIAAVNLFEIYQVDSSLFEKFSQHYQFNLLTAISLIKEEYNVNNEHHLYNYYSHYYKDHSYKKLKNIANYLITLLPMLLRKGVKNDCQRFVDNIKNEMKERKELCDIKCKEIRYLKSRLDEKLEQIRSTNSQVYYSVIANNKFKDIPYINIEENDEYGLIVNNYLQSLNEELSRLNDEATKFYDGSFQKIVDLKFKLDEQLEQIKSINFEVYRKVISNNKINDIRRINDSRRYRIYINLGSPLKSLTYDYLTFNRIEMIDFIINIEENYQHDLILNNYVQFLRDELSRLKGEVTKFYEDDKKRQLSIELNDLEYRYRTASELAKFGEKNLLTIINVNIAKGKASLKKAKLAKIISPFASFIIVCLVLFITQSFNINKAISSSLVPSAILTIIAIAIFEGGVRLAKKNIKEAENQKADELYRLDKEEKKILKLLSI